MDIGSLGAGLGQMTWFSVLMRLSLATFFGCTLGIERTRKGRAAGMRTYGLVSAGAALVIMTSQYINIVSPVTTDPTRMAAQVISGIGFLGAGTILLTARHKVTGLTTAAGLWISACIGLAMGVGFYIGAVTVYAVSFILIALFDNYREHIGKRVEKLQLFLMMENKEAVPAFIAAMREAHYEVSDLMRAEADIAGAVNLTCSIGREDNKSFERKELIDAIYSLKGVSYVEDIY